MEKIKIFDAEITSAMSYQEILKICKTVENASVTEGNDVEKDFYAFIKVTKTDKNIEGGARPNSEITYEVIFNDGKLDSVELWDIKIEYSRGSRDDIRIIQS